MKAWNTIPPNYHIIQRKRKERSNHTKKSEIFKENKRQGACFKNFDISIGRMYGTCNSVIWHEHSHIDLI